MDIKSKLRIITSKCLGTYYPAITPIEIKSDIETDYTDGKSITIKESEFEDMLYGLMHEVLHILLKHIRRGKQICRTETDFAIWNLATDAVIWFMLDTLINNVKILEKCKRYHENAFHLTPEYYELPAEAIYKDLKSRVKSVNRKFCNKKLSGWDVELIFDDRTQTVFVPKHFDRKSEQVNADYALKEFINTLTDIGTNSQDYEHELNFVNTNLDLSRHLNKYLSIIQNGLEDLSFLKLSKFNIVYPSYPCRLPSYISYKIKCVIGIDVSGSISNHLYSKFISIIKSNSKYLDCKVLLCDTEIKAIINLDETISTINKLRIRRGAGGTNFNPVFDYAKKNHAKLLLYFTDLEVIFPPKPNFRVVWLVPLSMQNYKTNIPYGKVIWIL